MIVARKPSVQLYSDLLIEFFGCLFSILDASKTMLSKHKVNNANVCVCKYSCSRLMSSFVAKVYWVLRLVLSVELDWPRIASGALYS